MELCFATQPAGGAYALHALDNMPPQPLAYGSDFTFNARGALHVLFRPGHEVAPFAIGDNKAALGISNPSAGSNAEYDYTSFSLVEIISDPSLVYTEAGLFPPT